MADESCEYCKFITEGNSACYKAYYGCTISPLEKTNTNKYEFKICGQSDYNSCEIYKQNKLEKEINE